MFQFFKRKPSQREAWFHEDDYCQQQLLPIDATGYAEQEIKKINEFSDSHLAPDGAGWTEMYMRQEAPIEFISLNITKDEFSAIISPHLAPFDVVFTGYSKQRNLCEKTSAWGRSQMCALFADWNELGIIKNVWAEFFEKDEESITAVTKAISALGARYPTVYVDWAWGYTCNASDEQNFRSLLQKKLEKIAENIKNSPLSQ